MQVKSQVFLSFSSIISSRQISLQAQITQEIEDSQRLLHILARTKYHKKGLVNDMQLYFEFEAGNDKEYEIDGI